MAASGFFANISCAMFRFLPISATFYLDGSHIASRRRFLPELEDHLRPHDAEQMLTAVIDWGRYAEIFLYDEKHRRFSLPAINEAT